MKLIGYHQLIMQGMNHLNSLTNLNCIWYDEHHEKVHAFSTNPVPASLDFQHLQAYDQINKLCTSSATATFCIAATGTSLEFIFIPLVYQGNNHGMIRIGPYLTTPMTQKNLSQLMNLLNLSLRDHTSLKHYYNSLEVISNQLDLNLGYIAMNLFGHTLSLINHTTYTEPLINKDRPTQHTPPIYDLDVIEKRYEVEHLITHAISTTNRELLDQAIIHFQDPSFFPDRHPENPLRSAKNISIVLNTILRHAAEAGGLNPYYIHQISSKYALLIEQCYTRSELNKLQLEMYESYFEEVKQHAYKDVAPFVKKIIDYIQLNLDEALTVTTLSKIFNINVSNLANQFKKETNKTISQFIHENRVKKAAYYLDYSDLSISEISMMVGYQDANYFTRIFKKIKGRTPTEYRDQ